MALPLVADPAFAALVNSTGTGQDGTVVDKAAFTAIATAIDAVLVDAGNPTRTPAQTTAEVITARGALASLNARISGVIDANGVFLGVSNTNVDTPGVAGETITAGEAFFMSNGKDGLVAGKFYRAVVPTSATAKIRGIATATVTIGNSGLFRTSGQVTGLAGLTVGASYYTTATPGALSAVRVENSVLIGEADTATSIVLTRETSVVEAANLVGVNLCKDPTFLIWAAGDALAPTHYTLAGAGAAISRTGTGLGDTNRKFGAFAAKIVAGGGAAATLVQSILTAASFDSYFQSKPFAHGAWMKCSSPSVARVMIDDGVGQTYSAYHTGGGGWEFLTAVRMLNVAATKISVGCAVAISGTAYVSGPTTFMGVVPPESSVMAPCVLGSRVSGATGTVAVGTQITSMFPARPGIVKHVQLHAKTVNTGAALIVDVNTWDGGALTSMFATRPQIAASASPALGGAAPDGTYARRCMSGTAGSSLPTGGMLTWDVDQVGSTIPGLDLTVEIRILQFTSPLEAFLGISEFA